MDIGKCQNCSLYRNQLPLLDTLREADIMWVGLSAKKVPEGGIPLSPDTASGKLIREVEATCGVTGYKTNLVKCLPLRDGKLRYPDREEMSRCFPNLLYELSVVSPKIVFLLGTKVAGLVSEKLGLRFEKQAGYEYKGTEYQGILFVPVHHPSYISVYKKSERDNYVSAISKIIPMS